MATLDEAKRVKSAAGERLLALSGVKGVGVTRRGDGFALKVNVDRAEAGEAVPPQIDGVDVVIETIGKIRPLHGA